MRGAAEVRRGRRRLAGVLGALAVTVAACGGSGSDGGGRALGNDTVRSVEVIAQSDDLSQTIDAAVSPDGADVFFTATGPKGPGVYRVPAAGGTPVAVAAGSPFESPVGIATDGTRIYVAEPGARVGGRTGVVYALPVGGGVPAAVRGTEGTSPRGLEIVREGAAEVLYFTGRDATDGAVGVFKVAAAGANAPTAVAKGAPLVSPDAVTVAKDGVVYATDRGKEGGSGAVYRISGSAAATKLADVRPPVLAGVSLTLDESVLLVSSLSDKGTDQVLLVDLRTGKTGAFSRVIGENRNGAGIHRARGVNVFAWADVQRPGRVYRVDL